MRCVSDERRGRVIHGCRINQSSSSIGFGFIMRFCSIAKTQIARITLQASLLDCVREFVRKKVPTARSVGSVLAGTEHNILTDRVCMSVDRARRLGRLCIVMNTNAAEVAPEPAFHERTRVGVERSTGSAEHVVNTRWHIRDRRMIRRASLDLQFLVAAFAAFTVRSTRAAACTLTLDD